MTDPKLTPPKEIDVTAYTCPMTFVKVKLSLEPLNSGDELQVVINNGEPLRNVSRSAEAEGHRISEKNEIGDGTWRLLITKGQLL